MESEGRGAGGAPQAGPRRRMKTKARAVLEQHVRAVAGQCGQTPQFVWSELDYRSLVPVIEASMTEGALCLGCGQPFANELDIEIAYCEPPRDNHDYARLHAANVFLLCTSCARGKAVAAWLDEAIHLPSTNGRKPL